MGNIDTWRRCNREKSNHTELCYPLTKNRIQRVFRKNQFALAFFSALLAHLPVLVSVSLVLFFGRSNRVGSDVVVVLVESLSPKGPAKDADRIQDKTRSDFHQRRAGCLARLLLCQVCFLGVGCLLLLNLVVSYPNLENTTQ